LIKGKKFEDIYSNSEEIKNKISTTLKENWNSKTDSERDLLRIKNSESVSNFWKNESNYNLYLKEKFRKNRSLYNKTIQRDYLLNMSDEKKKEVAEKKFKTYDIKSDEEKRIITENRVNKSQKSIIKNTWGKKILLANGTSLIINSSFEEKFIRICELLNIEIKRGPTVKYYWNNKIYFYFVDFEIIKNGVKHLIELKGTHKWYYEELNNGKLEAKNQSVLAYLSIHKEFNSFQFILNNVKYYKNILEEL